MSKNPTHAGQQTREHKEERTEANREEKKEHNQSGESRRRGKDHSDGEEKKD